MAEGFSTKDLGLTTEIEHVIPTSSSALINCDNDQSRPMTPYRSVSTNEAALHEWTAWRISVNENLSHNLKVYHDGGQKEMPHLITGRLGEESFRNSVKVPSFGMNLRQTYGRRSVNQIQNHSLADDVFLMYGIPRVNLVRKNAALDRSQSADDPMKS